MADEELVRILRQGSGAWAAWRQKNPGISLDLSDADLGKTDLLGADLRSADLRRANLGRADLRSAGLRGANLSGGANLNDANLLGADLFGADLGGASLSGANLIRAKLSEANLIGANLGKADLSGTNLSGADLRQANLSGADLSGTDLLSAYLFETVFSDVDLSGCKNLETCAHHGPSSVDFHTLQRSGRLPLSFLRGVGLSDKLIDYLPPLLSQPFQFYSCFISHAGKDDDFARRLYADLQNKDVRCWLASEDMKIGDKILDTIDEAIRLRDKVLLVLSETSIASDWVEDEVTKAYAEERQRGMTVVFPIRLDDAVFTTNEAWARKLRDNRNISDFRCWKEHDAYQKALNRLLRDLRIETT
jgi:uncharacterized protein YjbI with pentapeptide repeats